MDLCCGSGALGAALAAAVDRAEVHAADIDPAAVRCARRNVARPRGQVYQGDLYQPLPAALRGRVDILLANVPYVPTGGDRAAAPEARGCTRPRARWTAAPDGLDVLRRVADGAPCGWPRAGTCRSRPASARSRRPPGPSRRVVSRAGRDLCELNATVVIGTLTSS